MKIVQVEDFFHPDAGYQINILSKYFTSFGHEVTVITAEMDCIPNELASFFGADSIGERDKFYSKNHNIKISRLPAKKYISGRVIFNLKVLIDEINKETPDVVYAHGNDTLTSIQIIKKRKKIKCPIVTDSHMVDMASTNKLRSLFRIAYRLLVTPIIKKERIPVVRTADTDYIKKRLGIPLNQAPIISFGSDTLLFHPDKSVKKAFRETYKIPSDSFVVIYAGKLDESKGGILLARALLQKINADRDVVFIVIGNASGNYKEDIESMFAESENRIIRFPTQKYIDLAEFYQSSDLAIFPKQCSLSFFDVQACGLPVLSENNEINVPRCSHGNGWNFEAGDENDLRTKIRKIAEIDSETFNKVSQSAVRFIQDNYDYEECAREYEKVILDASEIWERGIR